MSWCKCAYDKKYNIQSYGFKTSQVFAVRLPSAWWIEAQGYFTGIGCANGVILNPEEYE